MATAAPVAGQVPLPPPLADARVRTVTFFPDQVVTLAAEPGFATVVELSPDEQVENVVVGDSAGWQVTANKRGDRLVVKPLGRAGVTNMVVVTDQRRYVFLLQAGGTGEPAPFVVRFTYPPIAPSPGEQPAAATATVAAPAGEYRFRGTKALFPTAMRDDGQRTTISWARDVALPAIFAVDAGGREGLVNGRMVGGDYVIEGTARAYVFRLGKARAVATRRVPRAAR
ncbi:type VI secretion protein [Sphingomonas lenta]|uniref:Type VI secretion protein n=1 Tax=Sphingomonas lenta TaxID=1141887 RepID=A0A2A2SB02_9SPHN|nr:type VI secretion protein [Sphingomonas lenta]